MITLLESHMGTVDTCMVDFISMNLYSILSEDMQRELQSLEDDSIMLLPASLHADVDVLKLSRCPSLSSVVSELRQSRLEVLGLVTDTQAGPGTGLTSLSHWDKIMSGKKTHEVDQMSHYVSGCVSLHGVTCLVDLGSGKAYLSQLLHSLHHIPVLAIDGRESNSLGAAERSRNLQTRWAGLRARAEERARGETPSNRRTRTRGERESRPATPEARLVTLTKYVEQGSDISPLVQQHLQVPAAASLGVVGLHTCGDLAPSSITTFLHTERARLLCNVGCCYNHLTPLGFPLSNYLKSRQFTVGLCLVFNSFYVSNNCAAPQERSDARSPTTRETGKKCQDAQRFSPVESHT